MEKDKKNGQLLKVGAAFACAAILGVGYSCLNKDITAQLLAGECKVLTQDLSRDREGRLVNERVVMCSGETFAAIESIIEVEKIQEAVVMGRLTVPKVENAGTAIIRDYLDGKSTFNFENLKGVSAKVSYDNERIVFLDKKEMSEHLGQMRSEKEERSNQIASLKINFK